MAVKEEYIRAITGPRLFRDGTELKRYAKLNVGSGLQIVEEPSKGRHTISLASSISGLWTVTGSSAYTTSSIVLGDTGKIEQFGDDVGFYVDVSPDVSLFAGDVHVSGNLTVDGAPPAGGFLYSKTEDLIETSGSLRVSGALTAKNGLSGSLTTLDDGSSYLLSAGGVTLSTASNGQITITGDVTDSEHTSLSSSFVTHKDDSTIHFIEGDIDHGSISGLGDDDHTQYLLANGTRALAGNLSLGSNNLTNGGTVMADLFSATQISASGDLGANIPLVKIVPTDKKYPALMVRDSGDVDNLVLIHGAGTSDGGGGIILKQSAAAASSSAIQWQQASIDATDNPRARLHFDSGNEDLILQHYQSVGKVSVDNANAFGGKIIQFINNSNPIVDVKDRLWVSGNISSKGDHNLNFNSVLSGTQPVNTRTSSFTIQNSDTGQWLDCDTDSAGADIGVTCSSGLNVGTTVYVSTKGTSGNVVFVSGSGVTLRGNTTLTQDASAFVLYINSSEVLIGGAVV